VDQELLEITRVEQLKEAEERQRKKTREDQQQRSDPPPRQERDGDNGETDFEAKMLQQIREVGLTNIS
jgi:hypothetical protein